MPARNQGKGTSKDEQEKRAATLGLLWQARHNLTHNSGVLTGSDSMKLKVLARRPVDKGRPLVPTERDLRYVKRFFSETADDINHRVGTQLTIRLGAIHAESPSVVDPATKAQELADIFALPMTVATAQADPTDTA